jgi:hypothetical protein
LYTAATIFPSITAVGADTISRPASRPAVYPFSSRCCGAIIGL